MAPASDKKPLLSLLGGAARKTERGLLVSVRVQPRSSKAAVEGVKDGALRVRLTAPPAEGAANEQLVEVLSKEFGIKKSAISIAKGHSSRDKLVEVEGVEL